MDIIYIEDNDIEAELMSMGLEAYGINILHLSDTRAETLSVLETPPYQNARAIFIDMSIVPINGVEVAELLRRKGDQRPIFLLTAGVNPDTDLLNRLNVNYLSKPPRYPDVAQMLLNLG
jgi:CheY-like chemotaxis protein